MLEPTILGGAMNIFGFDSNSCIVQSKPAVKATAKSWHLKTPKQRWCPRPKTDFILFIGDSVGGAVEHLQAWLLDHTQFFRFYKYVQFGNDQKMLCG